jgi:hypothetical protein
MLMLGYMDDSERIRRRETLTKAMAQNAGALPWVAPRLEKVAHVAEYGAELTRPEQPDP